METTDHAALIVPSTSTPSSSNGGVTLEAIMAQLQHMDARFNTFSDELCQVNTHVSRIERWQARLGGFAVSPSVDEDGDDGADNEDEDASSASDDEATTF